MVEGGFGVQRKRKENHSLAIMLDSPVAKGFTGVRDRGGQANASSIKGETTGRRNGTHGTCATLMRSREQLLPGIPDEITLGVITPKLPWRAFFTLSCVSPSWQDAIRSNLVFEARVRTNSTETLIVHRHLHGDNRDRDREALALYSLSERCCYELPPIPRLRSGILTSCNCVAWDGQLYALGGDSNGGCSSEEVYVLDLARQRKWKQRASMQQKRTACGCSVLDGKIYAFGGLSAHYCKSSAKPLLGCEVYDTHENSWSSLMPLPRERTRDEDVARVGKELFVYGVGSRNLGAYDPAKNDWRLLERFWGKSSIPFVRKEKFYSLSLSGIDKYDTEENSWVNLHTNSFPAAERDGPTRLNPLRVWAGNEELLLYASKGYEGVHSFRCNLGLDELLWYARKGCEGVHSFQCNLGLDGENEELVWQETNYSCHKFLAVQCSIQL